MGYMTFNEIIDESYDHKLDGKIKIEKAIESALELVENIDNPKLRDILIFNKNHQRNVAEMELRNIDNFITSDDFDFKH